MPTELTEIETLYMAWLALENEREAYLEVDINDPRADGDLNDRAIDAANRVTSAPITCDRDALFVLAVEASFNGHLRHDEPTEESEAFLRVFKAAKIPLRASAYPPKSATEKLEDGAIPAASTQIAKLYAEMLTVQDKWSKNSDSENCDRILDNELVHEEFDIADRIEASEIACSNDAILLLVTLAISDGLLVKDGIAGDRYRSYRRAFKYLGATLPTSILREEANEKETANANNN